MHMMSIYIKKWINRSCWHLLQKKADNPANDPLRKPFTDLVSHNVYHDGQVEDAENLPR